MKYSITKFLSILAITTGLNMQLQKPALSADKVIASSSHGCSYTVTRKAWWGAYTYLNGCAINEATNELSTASAILGYSVIGASAAGFYVAGPYGAAFFGAAVQASSTTLSLHKDRLSYCKETTGQAYIRYYIGKNNYLGSWVFCD